jgi:hypothetical protein
MKPSKAKPSTKRITVPTVIRRPFRNPIPVQDELMKRFGPKNPTKQEHRSKKRITNANNNGQIDQHATTQ